MSDQATPTFRIVCEGDTDYVVLDAILSAVFEDHVATMIQPERPAFAGKAYTEMGSGWKGVRKWCAQCQERDGGLARAMVQSPLSQVSALIIHVDADIAGQGDIDCERSCPPASATVDELRSKVLEWAGEERVPDHVVLCIPSKSTETWVVAALYPGDAIVGPKLECKDTEAYLCGKPGEKLVTRESGRQRRGYRKHPPAFKKAASAITAHWADIQRACAQAQRFAAELALATS